MTLAIETHQLTRYFNDFCAVSGIDLAVERGTFYGFLGPNGAGKSTTIKLIFDSIKLHLQERIGFNASTLRRGTRRGVLLRGCR
jgi:ABC-type multidrug transport system ATPase subunit